MTATERLRALLDERGVEYELYARSCSASVWWRDSSGTMWRAHDNEEDELLSFYAYNSVTPEQAIAATLGSGTCRFKWSLARNGWADHTCSECGYRENTDIHVSLGWRYCPNCGRKMVDE